MNAQISGLRADSEIIGISACFDQKPINSPTEQKIYASVFIKY
jgi:hypothetical protein